MTRRRNGGTLAEDVYRRVRTDILAGRLAPGQRLHLARITDSEQVSLSVVREAITRLAAEGLVQATPQRGFRVRSLSLEDLEELTWMRIEIESLAIRESIDRGDVAWEADLIAAHHRLANTPPWSPPHDAPSEEWMARHREFHSALVAAAGNSYLLRLREQLFDAAELYRCWAGSLVTNRDERLSSVAVEHREILDATLARSKEQAATLLASHLAATARALKNAAAAEKTADDGTAEDGEDQDACPAAS